jgi:putative protein kinase ArgK-like GTPase of G3E family
VAQSIVATLSLQTFAPGEWRPPIVKAQATADVGTAELWAEIGKFRDHASATRAARQRTRQEYRFRELLSHQFLRQVEQSLPKGELDRLFDSLATREIDPYTAAAGVLDRMVRRAGRVDPPSR